MDTSSCCCWPSVLNRWVKGELLFVFCGALEGLTFEACGFTSGWTPPIEPQVVAEEAAQDNTVFVGGLCVEEPTDLLAEFRDE